MLKPETEEEAAKIAAARLEAITFISQQATTEFSDICQARNLLEKLLSLDKAILDSRAEHNGVRGSNTETSGSKIELEREREILHGLKKQSAAMYTELLEKQNLLVSEMKAVQDLRDGIATVCASSRPFLLSSMPLSHSLTFLLTFLF